MNTRITRCVIMLAALSFLAGADWLRFRGPNGTGVALDDRLPVDWGPDNKVAWRVELPGRGLSSPIVIGDRVIVTACSGYRQDRLHVLCFDAQSGRQHWERQIWATGRTMTHPKTSTAAPTPASDGQRIFACFSTNDLMCLDLNGDLLWLRGLMLQYPNASNSLGLASSPIVAEDTLVVKIESDSQSLALGLETGTGQTRWAVERPVLASWTSPVAITAGTEESQVVALQSGKGMTAYDPRTGHELWALSDGCDTIVSSVAIDDTLFVPSNGLVALKQISRDQPPVRLWHNSRLSPSTPSPLVYDGRVFVVSGSVLKCADVTTGELLWQLRLKGNITSSPIAAGGHLYFFNEDGLYQIVKPSDEQGQTIATADLGETILCSPAVAGDAMYVRSDSHLWKIAETAAESN